MKEISFPQRDKSFFVPAVHAVLLACLLLLSVSVCVGESLDNITFEVKFLLDSDQVLTGNLPTETLSEQFGLETCRSIEIIYLETSDKAFSQDGWINRIRWRSWKNKPLEFTFKKRYSITEDNIAAALAQVSADGLGGADIEIDWGYSKMTMNAAWEDSKKGSGLTGLSELTTGDAIARAAKAMPDEEKNWNWEGWGTEKLSRAQKIGPLQLMRAEGKWGETAVTLDILHIPGSAKATVELSFKATGYVTAAEMRNALTAELKDAGILLEKDSLKTQEILNACLLEYPENPDFILPESLYLIEHQAFESCAFQYVWFEDGIREIQSGAFENCANLRYVRLSEADIELEENALPEGVIIVGTPGSAADRYAHENGHGFIPE